MGESTGAHILETTRLALRKLVPVDRNFIADR